MLAKLALCLLLVRFATATCPAGGCLCACNCPDKQPIKCPLCPPPGGGGTPGNGTTGGSGPCEQAISAAFALSGSNPGALLGLVLNFLLSNLVAPILLVVLAGNNTVEGAVVPLANTLCTLVGLILLLLRSLGLLGALGQGGLLGSLLGGIGK